MATPSPEALATTTLRGVVSTVAQSFSGTKTFVDGLISTTGSFSGLISSTVVAGSDALKVLDGGRVNFSTADANAYFYRSAANTIRTPGFLAVGSDLSVGGSGTFTASSVGDVSITATNTGAGLQSRTVLGHTINDGYAAWVNYPDNYSGTGGGNFFRTSVFQTNLQGGFLFLTDVPAAGTQVGFRWYKGNATEQMKLDYTSGTLSINRATGGDAVKLLDGARVNLSTGDANCYLFRSAANVIKTLGSLYAGVAVTVDGDLIFNNTNTSTGGAGTNGNTIIWGPSTSGNRWEMQGIPNSTFRIGNNNVTYFGLRLTDGYSFSSYGFEGPTFKANVASGSDAFKSVDGGRWNLSTADTNCYLYRSAADTIRTPGSFTVDGALSTAGAFNLTSYTDDSATPGPRTVNKVRGKSAIAAGASSVVITNSFCTTNSQVVCTLEANDTTATFIKSSIASGTGFTLTVNANATAALKFSWHVIN